MMAQTLTQDRSCCWIPERLARSALDPEILRKKALTPEEIKDSSLKDEVE